MGWKRQPSDYAPWVEADDRSRAAVVLGDMAALDAAQATMTALNDKQTDQWSHFEQAELLVSELTELGAVDRAARAADDFLHRKSVWTMEPGINAWTLASDDVPLMLGALLRAGRITRAELDARRDEWIASWRRRLSPAVARYLWVFAYAEIAESPADAAEALARLPEFAPIPRHLPWRFLGARIGHMYLLAGRVDDALGLLERGPRECEPFEEPFTWVQSSLWLGEAREAKGDAAAACAEYATVPRRWAGFGSKSVTVAEARRRMVALKCPR
jgi:tetratricopeptide (TPR) repeat protein